MAQKAGAKSDLICTSLFLLGRLSFSGWSTEYFLRQQTSGICKFCLFQTMGALLESSQICVGFPSLFFDKQNWQKELCVLEMLEKSTDQLQLYCGCSTHAIQVLCKPGLFRASTPREVIACTANLLMLTIHARLIMHMQIVLSGVPQFSRFLPHDSSNHVSGKYLIIFLTSPLHHPWSVQTEDSLTFYSKLDIHRQQQSPVRRGLPLQIGIFDMWC